MSNRQFFPLLYILPAFPISIARSQPEAGSGYETPRAGARSRNRRAASSSQSDRMQPPRGDTGVVVVALPLYVRYYSSSVPRRKSPRHSVLVHPYVTSSLRTRPRQYSPQSACKPPPCGRYNPTSFSGYQTFLPFSPPPLSISQIFYQKIMTISFAPGNSTCRRESLSAIVH